MDIVALFPLLMMALDVLEKTGKKLFYILMVAVMFIINYYLAAMSLVYILLVGGMYLIFRCDRKQRREKAWDLGIGTFTGIALSAFVLIPVFAQLSHKYNCEFDDRGNIGKRYRRQDEIGTPFCITYDFDSETDNCVTVRFRDSMEQERVAIADLDAYFADKFTF